MVKPNEQPAKGFYPETDAFHHAPQDLLEGLPDWFIEKHIPWRGRSFLPPELVNQERIRFACKYRAAAFGGKAMDNLTHEQWMESLHAYTKLITRLDSFMKAHK
jgi:hypothetical protein